MVDLHDSLRPTGTTPPLPVSEIATRGKRRKRRRLVSTTGLAVATLGVAAFAISSLPRSSAETVTVADVAEDGQTESVDTPTDERDNQPSVSTTLAPADGDETSESPTTQASDDPPASGSDEASPSMEDTEPTTSSTVQADTAPEDAPSPEDTLEETASTEPHPMTTPGIRTSETPTSEWDDGYCIQVEVSNDGGDGNAWQVAFDLDGTIATVWNATFVEASSGTFVFSGLEGYNADIRSGSTTSFGTCVDTNPG